MIAVVSATAVVSAAAKINNCGKREDFAISYEDGIIRTTAGGGSN